MKIIIQIRSSNIGEFKDYTRMMRVLIKENLKKIILMVLNFMNWLIIKSKFEPGR